MIFLVEKIKEDVRVCIDQNASSAELVTDSDMDMLTLEDVIGSKIVEAVDRVHAAAPYPLLEQGHNFDGASDVVYWGDQESGWVLLPEDFLRLVVFEMSDWERPVYSVITPADPQYARQHCRVKALRGTAQRPVVAIAVRPEGRVLEFWSCKSEDAVITRGVYIPQASIDEGGGVNISERCYTAAVYMTAGLTMEACGETERAKAMIEMVKTYLEK
ncbi:MAG: hypothetical protein K6F72_00100 [Bacteroidales bacterium]|nr:hypothetical protein [Bacteroidales bacterium]